VPLTQNEQYKVKLAQCKTDLQKEHGATSEFEARIEALEANLETKSTEVTRLDRLNQHLIDQVKSEPHSDRVSSGEVRELQTKVHSVASRSKLHEPKRLFRILTAAAFIYALCSLGRSNGLSRSATPLGNKSRRSSRS
jgi:predicted RNase H-like nuclease (RuvC/YqgF family)